jgi:hypothetical protein
VLGDRAFSYVSREVYDSYFHDYSFNLVKSGE